MAERVPFCTLFESFQAPRQLRLLLHDACIISGALDMAGRTLEVQIESSETLPQAAQDALQQMLAQQYDLRQVLLHFCGTGEQKGDNGVIWGKTITGKLTPIGELNIKQGSAIVEGRVFKTECYETRRKGMWTLNFNISAAPWPCGRPWMKKRPRCWAARSTTGCGCACRARWS